MTITEDLFVRRLNKQQVLDLAHSLCNDPNNYVELIKLFTHPNPKVSMQAAWVHIHCADIDKMGMQLCVNELAKVLNHTNLTDSVIRCVLRTLYKRVKIPEDLHSKLIDKCIAYITDESQSIAVKAFSVHLLTKLVKSYPELKREISLIVNPLLDYAPTPAVRHVVKVFNK